MKKVEHIGHNIYVVDANYTRRYIAAIYLIVQKGRVAIIETGTSYSTLYVQEALTANKLSFDDVRYVIPTHVHLDHAGGAGELMKLCKNATLIIHPRGAKHMIEPSRLVDGTIAVYGEEKFNKLYGHILPIDSTRVIEADDGYKLNFNGRELKFIDTPGHARHHFCIWDSYSKTMFTGDAFGISYREFDTKGNIFIFPTTTPVQFDPDEMVKSIDKILSYSPKTICLTHFGSIEPAMSVVKQLKDGIRAFSSIAIEHCDQKNAEKKIEEKIFNYLLRELKEMNLCKDIEFCKKRLENDIKLNTQGLIYWQRRVKKNYSI